MKQDGDHMKKEVLRREFLKLKLADYSYANCKALLETTFAIITLKRWWKRFQQGDWNLRDCSRKPHRLQYKHTPEERGAAVALRRQTGYSAYQLRQKGISMSLSSIKQIIKQEGLSRGNKMEGQRLAWVRFERDTPNSMWQLDGTQREDGMWILPVEDDCSRYCLAIKVMEHMTTENVIQLLESCIAMHGKPREILTDNGPEFGGNGKKENAFDEWCDTQDIKHIRSGIHKPTTVGKIGRLQYTITYELPYCHNDYEFFRWRYNTDRPHRSLHGLTPHQVFFGWKRHKKYKEDEKTIDLTGIKCI